MSDDQQKERRKEDTFRKLTDDFLKDRKNQRRLSYIRIGIIGCLFTLFFTLNALGVAPFNDKSVIPKGEEYVSVVRISGQISPSSPASAEMIEPQLHRAFSDKKSKGVIIIINSPGGAVVQGILLRDLIADYRKEFDKKVIVYGEDILASGAYMASMAADAIYITPSTITGSIGVIQQSFGIKNAMEKVGVEARTIHSGEHKNRMSLFSSLSDSDRIKSEKSASKMHDHFIKVVKEGRGDRLSNDVATIFSGDFWVGREALVLGLVDGIDTINSVTLSEFGTKYRKDFTERNPVRGLRKMMTSAANEFIFGSVMEASWKAQLPQ